VAVLPTLLTLGNAVCGLLAILTLLQPEEPNFALASWLILIAMVFDGLDGRVARMTRTTSAFGSQLDSLCDAITFGVAPAILVVRLVSHVHSAPGLPPLASRALAAIGVIYACCALIRLARFNVETAQTDSHDSFAGLPSPGAGGFLASSVITYEAWAAESGWQGPARETLLFVVPVATFVLSMLMVSRIRYPHALNRLLRGFRPFTTLIEIVVAIVLVVLLHQVAIFVGFTAYVLSGPVLMVRRLFLKPRTAAVAASPAPLPAEPQRDESVH
jgi:CDP-diacylglycerol--serine O-phosphatidyltransferase